MATTTGDARHPATCTTRVTKAGDIPMWKFNKWTSLTAVATTGAAIHDMTMMGMTGLLETCKVCNMSFVVVSTTPGLLRALAKCA
jgi:hypothetical protein